jgi:hypothetical protein
MKHAFILIDNSCPSELFRGSSDCIYTNPTDGPIAAKVTSELVKARHNERSFIMSVGMILMIILILGLVSALPTWPYSRRWGFYPSGGIGLAVLILLVLVLMGRF